MPKINDRVVGTCSNCGGAVCVPHIWHGVQQPIPTCEQCGANPEKPFGQTIKMGPPKRQERLGNFSNSEWLSLNWHGLEARWRI